MTPPSNIISLGVLTVRVPALPVPNVLEPIALGLLMDVSAPKLVDSPLCPEIDSCSDAVTDTLPPDPEKKVALLIEVPPVKLIVAAWMFTAPAPPEPSELDAIAAASLMVRVGVETETGPTCPEPKLTLTMLLSEFCKTTDPSWKVPGRDPDMLMESDAVSCRLPVAPAPNVLLPIAPPPA